MGAPNPDVTALVQTLALQHWTVANTPDLTGVIAAVNQQLGPLGGEINALLIAFATAQLDALFAAQEAVEDITVADLVGDVGTLQAAVAGLEADTAAPVSAKYRTATAQSFPTGVFTIINYNVLDWDAAVPNVTTGAAWHFTVPDTGEYWVAASADASAGVQSPSIWCFLNGVANTLLGANSTLTGGIAGSSLLRLVAGNTIDFRLLHVSAGAIVLNGAATNNWVAIKLLSPNTSP